MDEPRERALSRRQAGLAASLLVLVLLASGGLLGLRLIARQRLQAGLAAWEGDRRAAGWTISHGPPQSLGWTPGASLLLPDARLAGAAETLPGGVDWRSAAITLAWSPLHPDSLDLAAAGPQSLRLGTAPTLHLTGGPVRATVDLQQPDATVPVSADALALALALPGADQPVTIAHLVMLMTPHPRAGAGQALLSLSVDVTGLAVPALPGLPADIAAAGALQGPLPPPGTAQARARAWQAAGGSIVIPMLTARSGPLALAGSATGSLDGGLQPVARADLRVTGAAALVDQLAAAGVLRRGQAVALDAVLGLLAHRPPDGGPPVVDLPLNWDAGAISLGGFTLAHTPDVAWGQ